MRRARIVATATATVTMALAAACAPSAPESTGGGDGGGRVLDATLTVATTTDVVNYNPLVGNSRSDYWITNLMYPHLLSIEPDGKKGPELAEKWGYVDNTTGFYEIRSGLTWSDGK